MVNDDRPRLFLFELLFFSRKKRRRKRELGTRIKNKVRLKYHSRVANAETVMFTKFILRREREKFGRSHDIVQP